jgi:hypothetical protein
MGGKESVVKVDENTFKTENYFLDKCLPTDNPARERLKIRYRRGLHQFKADEELLWCTRAYYLLSDDKKSKRVSKTEWEISF